MKSQLLQRRTFPMKECSSLLDGFLDISSNLDYGVGHRGVIWPHAEWEKRFCTADSEYHYLHISVHNPTHIDLPWEMDEYINKVKQDPRSRTSLQNIKPIPAYDIPQAVEILETYVQGPLLIQAYILDMRKKQNILSLNKEQGFARDLFSIMKIIQDNNKCRLILKDLAIKQDDIDKLLMIEDFKKGSVLLIYTGWPDKFWPTGTNNLLHPIFEAWHPIFLNPYLTMSAVEFTYNHLEVAGIGSDTLVIDCPLYFVEDIPVGLRSIKEAKEDMETHPEEWDLPFFQPVHTITLGKRKLLIENLRFPPGINQLMSSSEVLKGELILWPVLSYSVPDAVITKAYFRPN